MDEEVVVEQTGVYSTGFISAVRDAEHIRRRLALYFGDTGIAGLHVMAEELINNAVREVHLGHCRRLRVEILRSGALRIRDGGQGIPVDCLPNQDKHILECLLTQHLSGSPFESRFWPVGGLRVGLVSVCAVSRRLVVEIRRDGYRWRQSFARGKATTPLRKLGPTTKTGTTITVWPDPQVFSCVNFEFARLRRRFEELAMLLPTMQVHLADRRIDPPYQETIHLPEGLIEGQRWLGLGLHPVHSTVLHGEVEEEGIKAQVAFRWHRSDEVRIWSMANGFTTIGHGTHVMGLFTGLTRARERILAGLPLDLPGGSSLTAQDLQLGLVAVVAVDLPDPRYNGSTKDRLDNHILVPIVGRLVSRVIETFVRDNPDELRAIARHLLSPPTIDAKSGMPK